MADKRKEWPHGHGRAGVYRFNVRHGCNRGSFLRSLRRGFNLQGASRNSLMGGKPGLGGQGCSTSIVPGPRRDWVQLLGPSLSSQGADSSPKAVRCYSAPPTATCQGPPLSYRPRKVLEGQKGQGGSSLPVKISSWIP